ncbi:MULTISPECIES: universal stress protein [Paenibacillus]|jgi:nucleotide-binding universal stress UspA family protein|uniref:UspA domain-containing protein n=2 Tax=Paenibacillus lactis TaxID=228574 RepID=G4HNM3_9BACL|nr:universal stress protein [Paenibacillus lactis]EHB50188.1 UspA domain-containing protein [Paenibacillus lactis 154]MBP1896355.1 nucleotide-binding universal stress UspA family protein [Paenibacillus lactis]MCM3497411.1 universal stress protein [Paenibacillus lactis]GIO94771.1 universal stress protein UspA [Paenibacillus lactis]HAG01016.1 universal stress protein [Paenibacillus lactis]
MLFTNILLAYDGSKAANKALGRAVELTQANPDATLHVVHAYDFPRFFVGEGLAPIPASLNKDVYDIAVQTTEEIKERIEHSGVNGQVNMIQGAPAEVILEYAKQNDIDLIVIGSRGLGGIREFVLGSVSHNVVQHATIPVLVVK